MPSNEMVTVPIQGLTVGSDRNINDTRNVESTSVPCFENLIHTFRGNTEDKENCLTDRSKLMSDFFEEVYLTGTISEAYFNSKNVPKDVNSKGEVVEKVNDISLENRHRAKILTSDSQIKEHRWLIDSKRIKEYKVRYSYFEAEEKEKSLNDICEQKFISFVFEEYPDQQITQDSSISGSQVAYSSVQNMITRDLIQKNLSKVLKSELIAFVRVCSERSIHRSKLTFADVNTSSNKQSVAESCTSKVTAEYSPRLFPIAPVYPELLEPLED